MRQAEKQQGRNGVHSYSLSCAVSHKDHQSWVVDKSALFDSAENDCDIENQRPSMIRSAARRLTLLVVSFRSLANLIPLTSRDGSSRSKEGDY